MTKQADEESQMIALELDLEKAQFCASREIRQAVLEADNDGSAGHVHAQADPASAQILYLMGDVHEYGVLKARQNHLLLYVFLVLLYIGLNVALLGANFQSQELIEEEYYSSFHMAAFWGVFGFTLLEAFILIATDIITWANRCQTLVILFNVMAAFATAMLFSFDPHLYEVPAHYMEYSIQILISWVNIIFLRSYMIRAANTGPNSMYRCGSVEMAVALAVLGLAMFTLIVYTGVIPTDMGPERAAHFCEFINEIFNGLFALAYATFCYKDANKQLNQHYKGMKALQRHEVDVL